MATTYGRPAGSVTAQRARYGRAGWHGRTGELATAVLLEETFDGRDDAVVFHDLRIPGPAVKGAGNIDHVIVAGKRVVIIDSKMWEPGLIWSFGGRTRRNGHRFLPAEKRTVGLAVDRLRAMLTANVTVTGLIVVHPSHPGANSLAFYRPPDGVRAVRAARGPAVLRRLLPPTATSPDSHAVTALRSLVIR